MHPTLPLDVDGTTYETYADCHDMIVRVRELKALGFTCLQAHHSGVNTTKTHLSGFCLFKRTPDDSGERCVNLEFKGACEPGFTLGMVPNEAELIQAFAELINN